MTDESRSVRVLVVDDEPGFAETVAAMLEREDDRFRVETATGASEGDDVLAAGEFDCVVTDYDMPGRNGVEFLRSVRETSPGLPFVLFTGKRREAVAGTDVPDERVEYLRKGADAEQYATLASLIRTVVSADREPHG